MDFLAIIISLLVLKFIGSASRLHFDAWFDTWLGILAGIKGKSALHFLAAVLIPSIFLLAVYLAIDNWFWGGAELVLSVYVLLYSVGRGKYKSLLREYKKKWRLGDVSVKDIQDLKQKLLFTNKNIENKSVSSDVVESALVNNDANESVYQQHFFLRETIFYVGFERVFVVLFWFALFGPVAAFLYRLISLYLSREPNNSPANQLLFVLEWPAARVMGLCYGVVGDFAKLLQTWLSLAGNLQVSIQVFINTVASAAINFQSQWLSEDFISARNEAELSKFAADEVDQMLALYNRALMCMLVFVALVEIIA